MIYGIYVRNKPTFRWNLVSVSASSELAQQDLDSALQIAKDQGFEKAEVALQLFESSFFVPETLIEIKKESKLLYN